MIKYVSFILLSILVYCNATGATYYVTPNGKDGASGTLQNPWSIQYAFKTAAAGDSVVIKGGAYHTTGSLDVAKSGSAGSWIVFAGAPGEVAYIYASGISYSVLKVSQKKYIRIRNLYTRFGARGLEVYLSEYIDLINNTVQHTWNEGIKVAGVYGGGHSKNIRVLGNTVLEAQAQPTVDAGNTQEGITFGRVENFELAYNSLSFGGKEGIDIKGPCRFGRIHHNEIHNHFQSFNILGIYLDGWTEDMHDLEVDHNIVHNSGNGIQVNSENAVNVYNVKVHHNTVYNTLEGGIGVSNWSKDGSAKTYNVDIYNNTLVKTGSRGISVDMARTSDVRVRNNIIVDCGDALQGIHGQNGTILEYNLITGNSSTKGVNSISGDPKFRDRNNMDFHLLSGSAAIGSGKNSVDVGRYAANESSGNLSLSTQSLTFTNTRSTQTFTITTDQPWVHVSDNRYWMQCFRNGNTVKVTISTDQIQTLRTGTIYVHANSMVKKINVTVPGSGKGERLEAEDISFKTLIHSVRGDSTMSGGRFFLAHERSWDKGIHYSQWKYNAPAAGTYNFNIYYKHEPDESKTVEASVNGKVIENMIFTKTCPACFKTKTLKVTFNKGDNTIQLKTDDQTTADFHGPSIDYFDIVPDELPAGLPETNYSSPMEVEVFPNPFSGNTFSLVNHLNEPLSLKIFDIKGKLVHEASDILPGKNELVFNDLDNGVYAMRVYSGSKIVHLKLIKLRE